MNVADRRLMARLSAIADSVPTYSGEGLSLQADAKRPQILLADLQKFLEFQRTFLENLLIYENVVKGKQKEGFDFEAAYPHYKEPIRILDEMEKWVEQRDAANWSDGSLMSSAPEIL